MSQAKKQYVVVFWKSWWTEEFVAFGPFTSKIKAAKAMAALYRSDWYRGRRTLAAVTALALACAFPLVALVALLGVALLTVAAHTVSLPITDPED